MRFLAGISSREEAKKIWNTAESEASMLDEWQKASTKRIEKDRHNRIYKRINYHSGRKIRFSTPYRIAAVVLLVLAVGAVMRFSGIVNQSSEIIEITCDEGLRKTVLLPDGSRVTLSGGSSLLYPQEFKGNLRKVEMSGLAFFDVVHDEEKPFVVSANSLNITVLGTKFSVDDFHEDEVITTTLLSGKVKVDVPGNDAIGDITLLPGQQVEVLRKDCSARVKQVDAARITGWINGRLAFDQVNIKTLCKSLERWYGVSIVIENQEMSNDFYTMTLENNTIDEVLALMHRISPMRYTIDNDMITITFEQN